MMFNADMLQPMMLFPDRPVLSYIIIYLGVSFVLWMARDAIHKFMNHLLASIAELKQRMAEDLAAYASRTAVRAKELATEYFLKESERDIEKGHDKLAHRVDKGLSGFPELQSESLAMVNRMNQAFHDSKKPPHLKQHPSLQWLEKEIREHTDEVGLTSVEAKRVGKALRKIESRMGKELKAHGKVQSAEAKKRLAILNKQNGALSKLQKLINQLVKRVNHVKSSIVEIDTKIEAYYAFRKDDDKASRAANQSIITRFAIAIFFVLIAVGGATLNFFLIERPLSEIVGGSGLVMGIEVSQMGAMMIIMLEVAAGVLLMEALGLSHLLPAVERWDPDMKKKVAMITGALLLAMAGVEAGLALLREMLVANDQATMNMLIGNEDNTTAEAFAGWGPMAVQAMMGFVIPLILAFVALPLEILFHVGRIIGQYVWSALMFVLARIVLLASQLLLLVMNVILSFYDLLIFFWVLVEGWVKRFAGFIGRRMESRA